jgi:integrase
MEIEYLPTEYCTYVATIRGRSRSPKTWKAYGHIILPFLRFMNSNGFDWKNPTEAYLAHYRLQLENKNLARARIARVMSVICNFYEWCAAKGLIDGSPITYELVMSSRPGMLALEGALQLSSRAILIPKVSRGRSLPRYFNHAERARIEEQLGERDGLIYDWGIYTGGREFELCAIEVSQILAPGAYRSRRSYPLHLKVTKGSAGGDLYVPTWLLDRTHQYIKFFGRAQTERAATLRGKPKSPKLFLGRWGRALQPDSVYNNFKSTLQRAGLQGTFHDLRHTYAISTLDALMSIPRKPGDADRLEPIQELKIRMRHESVTTTEKYLRARNFYLTEIDSDLWKTDM